jgi:hypothetical protein
MRSSSRDRIIRAVLAGDFATARAGLASFVTDRLMYAGDDREQFLRALEAVSDELLGVALSVAEGEQRTAEGAR